MSYFGTLDPTLTYQNLFFCWVPVNSIVGFIVRNLQKGRVW